MNLPAIAVFPDPDALARAAAERVCEVAAAAGDRFTLVLSGGSTPRRLHLLLAAEPCRARIPWNRTTVLFGDERCVPPDHPDSNYRMATETLLDRVPIDPASILRIRGEEDPERAAADYDAALRRHFAAEGAPRADLVLLGMGADGHTASLFPNTPALTATDRWVVANPVPRLGASRITWTIPALAAARRVLFLVSGADKAERAAEAFGGAPHPVQHPAEEVARKAGEVAVYLDVAAAERFQRK